MLNSFIYVLVVLIWGSTWFAIEFQLGSVAPEWSVAYRFSIAAVIMFGWTALRKQPLTIAREHHKYVALVGFFLFSTNYLMIYMGTAYITSGLVAVCFSFLTVLNIVNGRIFHKIPIARETFIGGFLGMIGLGLIFLPEISQLSLADTTTLGIGICLIGTLSASFGNTLISSPRLSKLPLLTMNAWGMFYGMIINTVYALLSGEPATFLWTFDYIVSMLVLSVIGTVLAFVLYIWLMGRIGMTKVAYVAVLLPLVALSVSTIFEGYIWTFEAITGLIFIITGNIIMVQFKPKGKSSIPLKEPLA